MSAGTLRSESEIRGTLRFLPSPGLEIVEVECLKEKDGEACSAFMGLASFWGEELQCQPRAGDAGVGFG